MRLVILIPLKRQKSSKVHLYTSFNGAIKIAQKQIPGFSNINNRDLKGSFPFSAIYRAREILRSLFFEMWAVSHI